MKPKIFVDGLSGTTGLKINDLLGQRDDVEILKIDPEKRRDLDERKKFINQADLVFLCLPDDAARESVSLLENKKTRFIDASTAHRTHDDWIYGIAELNKSQRVNIKNAQFVANPGCHATGFIMNIYPLINNGIMGTDYPVYCHSITGYSGGGKNMIAQYEEETKTNNLKFYSPRYYSLALKHKHLPEMQKHTGLLNKPLFTPVVGNFAQGMLVNVPLHKKMLLKNINGNDLFDLYSEHYKNEQFVKIIAPEDPSLLDNGFLDATSCNDTNSIEIFIFENDDDFIIIARFDNLGKGASGAAIQNMNILLGFNESKGLKIK